MEDRRKRDEVSMMCAAAGRQDACSGVCSGQRLSAPVAVCKLVAVSCVQACSCASVAVAAVQAQFVVRMQNSFLWLKRGSGQKKDLTFL